MQEIIWLAVAYGLGFVAMLLGLPVFVGYLIAGFALAGAGFEVTPLIDEASHIGVLLLLFTVGLHLNVRKILTREVFATAGIALLISTSIFVITCSMYHLDLKTGLFLGVLLSFSSTVIAAKDLESRNELGAYHGRIAIGILIIQDIVAVALLAMVGEQTPEPIALLAIPLLILCRPLLSILVRNTHSPDLMLLLAVLLALGIAELFHYFHLSPELGALMAGALVAGDERSEQLGERVWALKEIFLIGFFFKVGMLATITADSIFWASLILLVLPFKAVVFFLLLMIFRLRARTAFITGATLTSYSEFTLVGGLAGYTHGLITADYLTVLALATAMSFVINMPVNRLIHSIYDRVSDLLSPLELKGLETATHDLSKEPGKVKFLVIGMGRTGGAAYQYLEGMHYPVLGLDSDPVVVESNAKEGRRVLCADGQDPELWESIDLKTIDGVVVALPQLRSRKQTIRLLREAGYQKHISAFALDDYEQRKLKEAGADVVSLILEDAGARLAELSL